MQRPLLTIATVLLALAPASAARAQEIEVPPSLEDFRARESRVAVEPWLVLERAAFAWDRLAPSDIMRRGPFDLINLRAVPEATLAEAVEDLQRFWERNRLEASDQVSNARDPHQMSRMRWFVEEASRRIRIELAERRGAQGDPLAQWRGVDGKLDVYRVVGERSMLWTPEAARLPRRALNELQRAVIMSMGGNGPPFGSLSKANSRVAELMSRPSSWTLSRLSGDSVEKLREKAENARWNLPENADRVEILRHMTGHTPAEIREALALPAVETAPRARFTLAELANLKVHEIRVLANRRGVELPADMVPDKTTMIRFLTGMEHLSTFDVRELIAEETARQRNGGNARGENGREVTTSRDRERGANEGILDVLGENNSRRLREARARTRGRGRGRR